TIVLKDTGVTTVPINKDITITNGKFDITDFVAAHSNSIFDIYGGAEVKFEDVDFTGSNYSSSYGVIYAHETSKVTLNNCDFELDTEKDTAKGGVLKGNDYANDKFVVNNCNFTLNNTSRVFALMTIDMNGGSINATHEPISEEHAFRNVYGTIDDATISFDNFQNGIKDTANAALTFTNSTVSSTNMAEYDLQLDGGATVSGVAFENTNCKAVVSPAITTFANVASIGTTYYATLEEALAAAQAGEVITLLDDVTPNLPRQSLLTNAEAIDLNNNTLTLNNYDYYWGPMTFTNGTINVTTESFPGTAVFWQFTDEDLTFDGVVVNAPDLTGCYLINTDQGGSDINIVNGSVINVANPLAAVIASNGTNCSITIEESTVNANSTGGHAIFANNATVNLENGAELNADGVACGIYFGANGALNVADDAVVNITNVTGDPDWNANEDGIMLGTSTAYNVENGATVNATIAKTVNESNVADKVAVEFRKVDEKTYDIYVVPTDSTKAINRLSTAEMTFNLDADATSLGMTFDITGADNVNVHRDENDHVLFNFNGVNQADASGVEVKLGKVTFDGYGTFTFTVVPGADNKVQTAKINDNIVNTYTSEANTFVLGTGISGEVKVPTQKLTINIDFPNAVNDNVAAYQDMTVTVTGSNYNKEVKLGEGETAMVDGAYEVVIEGELVKDNSYTVTVSGAGYRTARYTVRMTDDKILNFWNNAKNNDAFIEDNEDSSKRKVTFLAGELVRDNQINIYDLSAVVSYFGEDNFATTHPEYVKYDLNRDGKIDSKDIAYVLVSWGK
ncbi:MAG: hypothetical protein PUF08_04275, partial [Clostridiales bacterium]|nr:hypothetical protein [Clostridiales bacterium]